jgi:alpha-galactosidase
MKSLAIFLYLTVSAVAAFAQTNAPTPSPAPPPAPPPPPPGLTSPDLWKPEHVPFSFKYDNKDSAQFLTTWQISDEDAKDEKGHPIRRYSYTDPVTKLKITADVRLFADNPNAIDWVLHIRNDGAVDSPMLDNILPLDWSVAASSGDVFIRHAKGSDATADDFKPLEEQIGWNGDDHLESSGGNPSSRNTLPYFNLQTGGHGLICAVGWTGNWKADFHYGQDGKIISLKSGMKTTHLLLHPGEEIRTPRIVIMNWTGGNWMESQNIWRRLLFAHYTPQENGKTMRGQIFFGGWGGELIDSKIAYIKWIHDHQIPVEVYAIDAGWYGDSFGSEQDPTNPWWKNRGDWFPSPRYYPNGIHPLGQACKENGLGFSLWVEPETTMPDKKIVKDHPDWYLQSDHPVNPGVMLAKLGNPETRKGLTDMLSGFITDFGMTWYRQDFNIPPDRYWELADTPNRVGMTEITHVEGLYQMWDDLLARHPGLHIDNCAGGGRRLDIELCSRSFIIWRSDHGFTDTIAEQAMTQALAPWVPLNMGIETYGLAKPWSKTEPFSIPEHLYLWRIGYNAGFALTPGAADVNNDGWVAWLKQSLSEYREVQPYFYGDFYPMLPYSLGDETWTVTQWDRPETKDGLVTVARRPGSPFTAMNLHLLHLDPDASYDVEIRTTLDKVPVKSMKGSDLAHLAIELPDVPSSELIFYKNTSSPVK